MTPRAPGLKRCAFNFFQIPGSIPARRDRFLIPLHRSRRVVKRGVATEITEYTEIITAKASFNGIHGTKLSPARRSRNQTSHSRRACRR